MANEKRLIEVESAWEKAQKIFSDSALLLAIRVALDKAPTVDAVEVVRCKDCKHWHEETGFCEEHSRFDSFGMDWNMFAEDDFCSYGERRTDERKAD